MWGFILPDPIFEFSGPLTALVNALTEEGVAELLAAIEEGVTASKMMSVIEAAAQELGVKMVSLVRGYQGQLRVFTGDLDSGWREAIRAYEKVWRCEEGYLRGPIIASDGGSFSGVWSLSLKGLLRLVQALRDDWVLYIASCDRGLGVDAQEYWVTISRGWSTSPIALYVVRLKQLTSKEGRKVYLVSRIPRALTNPLALKRSDDPNDLAARLLRRKRVTVGN